MLPTLIDNLANPNKLEFETADSLSLALADFNGKTGVCYTNTGDDNLALTLNDDLKDGIQRRVKLINNHATTTILVSVQGDYNSDSQGIIAVPAQTNVIADFYYDSLNECWELDWSGAKEEGTT